MTLLRRNALLLLLVAACNGGAQAQGTPNSGEVTKVDKAAARVTIKHQGVKNLDMPPMAMAFRVADGKLLEGLAPGDRVRFHAERIDGQFTVTALVKAP